MAIQGTHDNHTFKNLQSKVLSLLIARNNITRLQSQTDQLLRLLQQLARQNNNQVSAITHLSILLLTSHNQQLSSGVHNIQLAKNRSSVGSQNHLLQVVDDDLVAAIRAQGGLDSSRDGLASLDVADNGTIFGVVAVVVEEKLLARLGRFLCFMVRRADKEVGVGLRCGGMGPRCSFGRTSGTRL